MRTTYTKWIATSFACFCAAVLAGCADSGQGTPGEVETETVIAPAPVVDPTEPGVAPEPGTVPSVSTNYVYEAPARPAPAEPAPEPNTGSQQQPQQNANEQGAQQSAEPRTGDDANPDSINPR